MNEDKSRRAFLVSMAASVAAASAMPDGLAASRVAGEGDPQTATRGDAAQAAVAQAKRPGTQVRRHRPQPRAHQRADERHPARRAASSSGSTRRSRDLVEAFRKQFPQAKLARSEAEVLEDASVKLVLSAAIPDERAPLGIRVMQHGKDYMADKPGVTTLEQLAEVRRVQAETKRIYSIMYSERLENRATVKAGELVKAGAIGRVLQTVGLGPHRMNPKTRPAWFFERARYGGILCDIASHQADQFLFFTGSTRAEVVASQVGNLNHPQYPGLEDFGDVLLRGDGGTGYIRVDWFTPDGLATWGDGRLTILGTDGFIEIRKNIDIAGRPGGEPPVPGGPEGDALHRLLGQVPLPYGDAAGRRRAEPDRDGDAAGALLPGHGADAQGPGAGAADRHDDRIREGTPPMMRPAVRCRRPLALALLLPLAVATVALLPAPADAQALPGLSSLRVAYNTRKATANPQGELRAQLDAVDKALTAATRAGDIGEARRQLAKGMALLSGDAWTPALDYRSSLVIRSGRTVIDSSEPYAARLEQIYKPAIDLTPAMTARVSLLKRAPAAPPAAGGSGAPPQGPPPMVTVRDFGRMDGVARDLRESPFPMELDLSAVPDGVYALEAELFDGETSLGAVRLGLVLQQGLDARLRALEAGAAAAPEALRGGHPVSGRLHPQRQPRPRRPRHVRRRGGAGGGGGRARRGQEAARTRSRAARATWSATTCCRARTR